MNESFIYYFSINQIQFTNIPLSLSLAPYLQPKVNQIKLTNWLTDV